jgi:hypothetical protein
MGSWLTYGLGTENQNLPGFVAMCPGGFPIKGPDNWRAAFLPGIYEGAFVNTEHQRVDQLIENIRNARLGLDRQRDQLELLQRLNQRHLDQRGYDAQLEARIQSYEQAYRMRMALMRSTSPRNLNRSGRFTEYSCNAADLIARRLVERVRSQLWHGKGQPWDNHDQIEANHRRPRANALSHWRLAHRS